MNTYLKYFKAFQTLQPSSSINYFTNLLKLLSTANWKFSGLKTLIANSNLAQLNGETLKSKTAKFHDHLKNNFLRSAKYHKSVS